MPAPGERWFSSDHGAAFPEDKPSQTQLRVLLLKDNNASAAWKGALMPGGGQDLRGKKWTKSCYSKVSVKTNVIDPWKNPRGYMKNLLLQQSCFFFLTEL